MTERTIKDYRYFLKDSIRKEIDFSRTDQNRGFPPPPIQKSPAPGKEIIDLIPKEKLLNDFPIPLARAIDQRSSVRQFSDEPLILKELSFLLWATQGVRTVMGNTVSLRTVPSAGARHSFETYLYIRNVEIHDGRAEGEREEQKGRRGKEWRHGEREDQREGRGEEWRHGEGEEQRKGRGEERRNGEGGGKVGNHNTEKVGEREASKARSRLKEGLYRYLPLTHQIVLERPEAGEGIGEKLAMAAFGQRFVMEGAVTFLWSTIPYRMEWRYGLAAHRVIALDAGHVCQNLYLACEAIGAGTCAIGAYDQEKVDAVLGLDGEEEFVLYLAPVGKKR